MKQILSLFVFVLLLLGQSPQTRAQDVHDFIEGYKSAYKEHLKKARLDTSLTYVPSVVNFCNTDDYLSFYRLPLQERPQKLWSYICNPILANDYAFDVEKGKYFFFPHINAQNEPKNKDSIVVKNVDVYVEYCLSNDATIEFAIKNNIPIHYPILIINDEIISDENDIDIIRNTVTHTRKLCGITVCNRLGPYRIKRIMRYSSSQAEKKGIIAQDGVVAISLQSNTILDVIVLKTWLINNRKETSYLNDETDYR